MERYSEITEKAKREIVLLRGRGCAYRKCTFCDYHLDCHEDDGLNFELNKSVLDKITGKYGDVEIINSGSVFELDKQTVEYIKKVCREKGIRTIHFEAHYLYDEKIPALREEFKDFTLKMKIGLETFDYELREGVYKKGIPVCEPEIISKNFDEANFLFGLEGQSLASMQRDIELGLEYFERICINLMCDNSTPVEPDKQVIELFLQNLYPKYKDDYRVDILINNTDFGVGE
ncbi:MAG: radical SAM protein [Clostridia bacterium]|nr:radical SAM protein [Clostridia bacterium]